MNGQDKIKRYQTDIKSAFGSFAICIVLTLIYMLRTLITKNYDFCFCLSSVEVLMKLCERSPGYPGELSFTLSCIFVGAVLAVCVVVYLLAMKKTSMLFALLGLYAADSAVLAALKLYPAIEPVGDFTLIDAVLHTIVLLFLILGCVSYVKMQKLMQNCNMEVGAK